MTTTPLTPRELGHTHDDKVLMPDGACPRCDYMKREYGAGYAT